MSILTPSQPETTGTSFSEKEVAVILGWSAKKFRNAIADSSRISFDPKWILDFIKENSDRDSAEQKSRLLFQLLMGRSPSTGERLEKGSLSTD